MKWRLLGVWLPALAVILIVANAYAQTDPAEFATKIREKVKTCFMPPLGATQKVLVVATFEPDGSMKVPPVIAGSSDGAVNEAFAQAARRAVIRCAPYDVGFTEQTRVTLNFVPPDMPDAKPPADVVALQTPVPEMVDLPRGGRIALQPPKGLCLTDPTHSGFEQKLWKDNPYTARGGLLFSVWIDCDSLTLGRTGDLSLRPRHIVHAVEIVPTKTQPKELSKFIDFLVKRDEHRYTPLDRFLSNPRLDGATYLGHDEKAVYYVLRKVKPDGTIEGAAISSYTIVKDRPLLLFYFRFGANFDDTLRSENARLVETLHAVNR